MAEHRVAILSDTHSLLRSEVKETLQTCEVILHVGDIADRETVLAIEKIAKAYFVRGNADKEWAAEIPKSRIVTLFGLQFFMVHNKRDLKEIPAGTDVVLLGHSHKYEETKKGGVLYCNPGSCGPRRFHQPVTMAVMTIDDEAHTIAVEKKDFSPTLGAENAVRIPQKDMDILIRSVMKDMDAGHSVETIARRNRIEEELARQILQIYTTHPGIDVPGVLSRMEIWGK